MTDPIKRVLPKAGSDQCANISDDELKVVIKGAIKEAVVEWIESQQARVGKWTISGLAVLAVGGLVYLALTYLGFRKGS